MNTTHQLINAIKSKLVIAPYQKDTSEKYAAQECEKVIKDVLDWVGANSVGIHEGKFAIRNNGGLLDSTEIIQRINTES